MHQTTKSSKVLSGARKKKFHMRRRYCIHELRAGKNKEEHFAIIYYMCVVAIFTLYVQLKKENSEFEYF